MGVSPHLRFILGGHCTVLGYVYNFRTTEVFGSTGSVGTGHFVRYSRKSVTLDIFNVNFQFGDCQNVRYSRKSVISESGTSENLCTIVTLGRGYGVI